MKNKKPDQMMNFRMPLEMHRNLRKLSFLSEKPIAEIIRQAIENFLKDQKKVLTNSDIVVS